MLGSHVVRQMSQRGIDVFSTTRRANSGSSTFQFDLDTQSISDLIDSVGPIDYVVNAIGFIKSHIRADHPESEYSAIKVNSLFPRELARVAEQNHLKVIQIETDCVYSGADGNYSESASHDALDVYGKSKSLGEVDSPAVMHIRCSIIGREVDRSTSLVEWVLGQALGAHIDGYANHRWNGVTADVFSKLCAGIVSTDSFSARSHHLVPDDSVTKLELVSEIARAGGRADIFVKPVEAETPIDRTLSTNFDVQNRELWSVAGFDSPPTIREMVEHLP